MTSQAGHCPPPRLTTSILLALAAAAAAPAGGHLAGGRGGHAGGRPDGGGVGDEYGSAGRQQACGVGRLLGGGLPCCKGCARGPLRGKVCFANPSFSQTQIQIYCHIIVCPPSKSPAHRDGLTWFDSLPHSPTRVVAPPVAVCCCCRCFTSFFHRTHFSRNTLCIGLDTRHSYSEENREGRCVISIAQQQRQEEQQPGGQIFQGSSG